jgi:predicted nucleic acid-binding protein
VTLCDTGPLVALIDSVDPRHQECVAVSISLPASPLITTWACLTEAMHFLHRVGGIDAQNELWTMLVEGTLRLHVPDIDEWRRVQRLMNQYADMPLDIADATLVSAAEHLGERRLFTLDNHLRAVRIHGRDVFDVIP